jgi:hypothetical protein
MKLGNVALAIIIWGIGILISIPFGFVGIFWDDSSSMCFIVMIPLLIFFVIGLIVLLKGREKQPQLSKPIRYCPKCGREIPFDAVFCPYCQYNFK